MDSEEVPPPPYSAVDPLLTEPNNGRTAANGGSLQLRGGNAALSRSSSSVISGPSSSASSPLSPANFESAVAYFSDRPPTALDNERDILHHHLTIFPRSQAKDFPRRPRCWNSRAEEVTQQDWDMFLRYLFPPNLGLASASSHLSRQLRAQIQRDRKDRPQETDEQRRLRITAVITEWNQCFFEPRAVRLMFSYIMDPANAPSSSLCPKCYPAATKATQESRPSRTQMALGRNRQSSQTTNTPPATPVQPAVVSTSPAPSPGAHAYASPYGMGPPAPYAPYGPPGFYQPGPQTAYPPGAYPPPQPQYNYYPQYQWGWNNRPYAPQPQSPGNSKGGALGWFSQLASSAQKYGERISEQAQQYGDQISAHAQHYTRQVEEQALAHGRWLEEQAGLSGRKVDTAYPSYPVVRPVDPRYQHYYYNHNYPYPPYNNVNTNAITNTNHNPSPTTTTITTTNNNDNGNDNSKNINQNLITYPNPRPRSSSLDSTASDSSLTSIDSLSTTSDLSSSDLATVRAQLLSLEDHHDRELYEAAVGLRRQLDVMKESHRQSHASGSAPPRNELGQYLPDNGDGRNVWGQWQSSQQHQQSWADKRAAKEEMRATKKAFREVLRRAREEQRERRRNKRMRRRQQEQRLRQFQREEADAGTASQSQELSLEQRLQNLDLEKAKKHDSQPTVRSSASFPSTARSISSSEASEISSISTPSTASFHEGDDRAESSHPDTQTPEMDSKAARKQTKEQQRERAKQEKGDRKGDRFP